MPKYITELQVSLDKAEEINLSRQGFTRIPVDLNKGAGGNDIFLWYKRSDSSPITRIQCSFDEMNSEGLYKAGYLKVNKDLNKGAGGSDIFLWYHKGSSQYEVPIVDLRVSCDYADHAMNITSGWEPLSCDLNRKAGGKDIYLWVKREKPTYIKEIIATKQYSGDDHCFLDGYIRLDEDTNRGAGGSDIFIWYRPTTNPAEAIRDLQISINKDEYTNFEMQGYQVVNQDLNEGAGGNDIYLWYTEKDPNKRPIKAMFLILNQSAIGLLVGAGVTVIMKPLNSGNKGVQELLCFYK